MRTELIETKIARIGAELVQARELAEFLSTNVGCGSLGVFYSR
jgi:hypothetical protein